MKNKLKNRFFDHLSLKLLALLLSLLIWLIVMNVEDYTVTKQIKGIPVEQLNGDVIEELDKVYDVTEGETVDIVVKGRRTLVDSLTAKDFTATADLSQMSITNTVQIVVTPNDKTLEDELSITYVNNTMVLSIEDKVTAQLPLIVETTGQVADGYALGSCTATPNLITVEGPKSVVDKVTEIRAVVDVSMRFESFSVEVEPVCYDVYGESMSGKQLSLDVESVKVSVPVYPTKEVSLQVETSGKVGDGYEITAINYHPQTIVIAAEEADLKAISAIHINNISVTGQTESMEVNLDIEDYLPANVYLADSNQQVAVSITIEKLEERKFALQATDVELKNQNEAYDYELVIPENYSVHITGLKADIEEVTIANMAPAIDCSNLEIGTYDVELTLKDGSKYTASNDGTLQLIVSEKEEIQEDTTDGEGDTEAE